MVKEIIVSGLAIKQEIQQLAMDDLVESMVLLGNGQAGGTQKAYALYSLLFVSKDSEV